MENESCWCLGSGCRVWQCALESFLRDILDGDTNKDALKLVLRFCIKERGTPDSRPMSDVCLARNQIRRAVTAPPASKTQMAMFAAPSNVVRAAGGRARHSAGAKKPGLAHRFAAWATPGDSVSSAEKPRASSVRRNEELYGTGFATMYSR